jgi:predicted DCC family thiol-disulfide oxidoreductase YuxK
MSALRRTVVNLVQRLRRSSFLALWPAFVARVRKRGATRTVVFDGSCGICTRTIAAMRRLDILGRLRIADVRVDWVQLAAAYPFLNAEACLTDMHVIVARKDGEFPVETGFDAYRSIGWVLPIAWPLLPLLYVPGVPFVGRRVYRFVASRRSSACTVPLRTRLPEDRVSASR